MGGICSCHDDVDGFFEINMKRTAKEDFLSVSELETLEITSEAFVEEILDDFELP